MKTSKLHPGSEFPEVFALDDKGEVVSLASVSGDIADWKLVLVYRGRHCPLCTRYLNELESFRKRLEAAGVGASRQGLAV